MKTQERTRSFKVVVLALTMIGMALGGGQAEATKRPKPSVKAQETAPLPADVTETMSSFDDLGILRVMTPLKLKPEQLDALIEAVSAAQREFNQKNGTIMIPGVRAMAENIHKYKQMAFAGKEIPNDEAMTKAMIDLMARRKKLDETLLKGLSDKMLPVLTKTQTEAASKIAKEEQAKVTGKAATGSTAQFLNLYILRVWMSYPRILPLLREWKATLEAGN